MRINYQNRDHWDPTLKQVVQDIEDTIIHWTKKEPILSSDYRPQDGPGKVHNTIPLRAVDIVTEDGDANIMASAAMVVSGRWVYDPARAWMVVAHAHDTGSGMHIHVQVHPNTVRFENGDTASDTEAG